MPRKRRPVQMPIAEATEALYWRAKILHESFEHSHTDMALCRKQLGEALEDYRASKNPQLMQIYECKACAGTCTTRTDGLCNRCYDRTAPLLSAPMFSEMQS